MYHRGIALTLLIALVGLVSCSKKPEEDGWVINEQTKRTVVTSKTTMYKGPGASPDVLKKTVKPIPELPPLKNLKFTLPNGWVANFLDVRNEWSIDKRELKKTYRLIVSRAPVQTEPTTLNDYIRFLQEQTDEQGFVWPRIDESGALPDGFYIYGRPRLASDVTNTRLLDVGFVGIRTIQGDRFRFKCHHVPEDARQDVLAICKSAQF